VTAPVPILTNRQVERLCAFAKDNRSYFSCDPIFNPDTGEWRAPIKPECLYSVQAVLRPLEEPPDRGLMVVNRLPVAITVVGAVWMYDAVAFDRASTPLRWTMEGISMDLNDPENPVVPTLPGPPVCGQPCISRHGARARLSYQRDEHGLTVFEFQLRVMAARIVIPRNIENPRPWMFKDAVRRRAAAWAQAAAATLEDAP
jgi:hypothetical protein